MVKKYRVELGFYSILIRELWRRRFVSAPDTTFAAADGLISSAAHQSLTTATASPTSFPRALLLYCQ